MSGGRGLRSEAENSGSFYRPPHRRHLIRRRFIEAVAAIITIWVFYVFVFSDYGLRNLLVLKNTEAELEGRIARLQEQRSALTEQSNALKDDPKAIEKVAREKYFLGLEGERTYIFVPVDSAGSPIDPADADRLRRLGE